MVAGDRAAVVDRRRVTHGARARGARRARRAGAPWPGRRHRGSRAPSSPRASERPRGDGGDGGGADLGYRRGVEDRRRDSRVMVKQGHDPLVRIQPARGVSRIRQIALSANTPGVPVAELPAAVGRHQPHQPRGTGSASSPSAAGSRPRRGRARSGPPPSPARTSSGSSAACTSSWLRISDTHGPKIAPSSIAFGRRDRLLDCLAQRLELLGTARSDHDLADALVGQQPGERDGRHRRARGRRRTNSSASSASKVRSLTRCSYGSGRWVMRDPAGYR